MVQTVKPRTLHLPLVVLIASLVGARGNTGSADTSDLPALITYTFTAAENTILSFSAGNASKTLTGRTAAECDSSVGAEAAVDELALVVMRQGGSGSCWKDSRYSNGDYLVEKGTVDGRFTAYKVSPPGSTASEFVASHTNVYFSFPSQESFSVYTLHNGVLQKVASIAASSVTQGQHVPTGIRVDNLQSAAVFVFVPATTSVPAPADRVIRGTEATECSLNNIDGAAIRDVAVVTMRGGNSACWTDGRYNYFDFRVQFGSLSGSDGSSHQAYRFYPPTTAPTQFASSKANIYFKPAEKVDYKVASYDGKQITVDATIASSTITAGSFVQTPLRVSDLTAAKLFVFLPADRRFTEWSSLSSTVEGAWLGGSGDFSVAARRFDMSGHPFIPGADWGRGPGTHQGNYGIPKKFLPVTRSDGREGVVWQDQTAHSVHMTWFSSDLLSAETSQIYSGNEHLVGATSNGVDQIVLLLIGRSEPAAKTDPNTVKVVKASSASGGGVLMQNTLDASKSGLNVHKFDEPGASMVWNVQDGNIGVVLARTMTQGGDGLNHQGAIAFVITAATLQLVVNHGQTSGHSFSNSLMLQSDGNFLSMDLGDNYPRGINLQRFNAQNNTMRGYTVYNFKTKHGTTASSPAGATYPAYAEISTGSTQYYKWSNDNYVYTELGHRGVVEVSDGIMVFFSGERPPLDSSKVGDVLNEARNVGFVKVGKDISQKTILSPGATETGGFYTFGGSWSTQTNQGVNFLTSFASADQSASRLKTADLGSAGILLYWEIWTKTAYRHTQLMLVDGNGTQLVAPWSLNHPVRLAIQDDLLVRGGRAIAYAGTSGKLVRYEICSGGNCPQAAVANNPGVTTTVVPTSAPLLGTVSLVLPAVQGATPAQLQAAVETPAAKAQLASTIATGLGISASRVTVTGVTVTQARRLEGGAPRRLSSTTLQVAFEIASGADDAAVSASVGRLADANSQENSRFVAAMGPALSSAATTDGSSVLSSLSSAVTSSGMTVSSSGTTTASTTATVSASARSSIFAHFVFAFIVLAALRI